MLSVTVTPPYNGSDVQARQPSPLPRRTDSLPPNGPKSKPTNAILHAREDLKYAQVVLSSPIIHERDAQANEGEQERQREDRERELTEMLGRMANRVDELATLLQQAYKNQTDLETALTLTRSNLQLALANNEMLEEALKRGGNKDVGWRRWSDREGGRRTSSVHEYTQEVRPSSEEVPQIQAQSGASRFFNNFKSPLQRVSSFSNINISSATPYIYSSSSTTSPVASGDSDGDVHTPTASSSPFFPASAPSTRTSTPAPPLGWTSRPPSPPPLTPREQSLVGQLSRERSAREALTKEKTQLENELESLSQALFEEANKMVSDANRKLAETEEELRNATEQKEALRSALRIVEGENGQLRGRTTPSPIPRLTPTPPPKQNNTPHVIVSATPKSSNSVKLSGDQTSFWSPLSPAGVSPTSVYSPFDAESSASPLSSGERSASSSATWHPHSAAAPPPSASTAGLTPSTAGLSPWQSQTGTDTSPTSTANRWSVLPKTPRSRDAARNEFESAMQRMQGIVSEADEKKQSDEFTEQRGEDTQRSPNSQRPDSAPAQKVLPGKLPVDVESTVPAASRFNTGREEYNQ